MASGQPPRSEDRGATSGRRGTRGGGDAPRGRAAADRRARAADRDERLYERKRWQQARARREADEAAFDPAPPSDDDWTVPDEQTDALHRLRPPTPLNDSLQEFVRRRGWDERLRGASAWSRWDAIVGPDLAERCEPLKLVRGVLTIRAENQVWATQLRYMIPHLRENVESAIGEGSVREVVIVVGRLEGRDRPDAS